jgi:hypothetical protein
MFINELCLCFAIITYIATLDWLRLVWLVFGLKFNYYWLDIKT